MDELIEAFLSSSCTPEYANEVYRSFKICGDFEYPDLYSSFIDILTNEDYATTDQLRDEFHNEINTKLNYVLKQHNIEVISTASIHQKNELLIALFTIQDLEDYSAVISVLESLETDEVKLTAILEDYCQLDQTELLTIIEYFNPITLKLLKDYINQKQYHVQTSQSSYRELVPTLKVFFTLFGHDNVGHALIENDVKPGQRLEIYLNYIDNVVSTSDEQTATNVLSMIYLTPESQQSPLEVFNQHSLQILKELSLVPKIEKIIISMINKVNETLKASQLSRSL